ncbi:hypothetical protein B0H10DRAFT_295230 [Mycena sp. CBHHK59/15]|nr:hypothetical protein B0H10DRAFT_295230 [Mycena sp. CBHHK59/15]
MDGGHATWLIPLFPRLSTFRFPDAPTRLNPKDFTNSGRRRGVEDSGPESGDQHGSGNEGEGGSEGKGNSSNEDSGSNYSDTHRAGVISLSPSPSDPPASTTTIYAGSLRIRGLSQGELARSHGYSLRVTHFLAAGVDGLVYAGVLSQGGSRKSEVAIKVSEDPQVIREEYQNYLRLSGPLDQHIPRCYGVVSAAGATFLVTALVTNRSPAAPWTVAQRGAVYQMLQAMHDAGWSHNDIVDSANSVIHNVLWDTHGRPVLIDFVTAAPHLCRGKNCPELKATQRVLRLSQHAIDIWARGIVRKSALN